MSNTEQEAKRDLLGTPQVGPTGKRNFPDPDQLRRDFEREISFLHAFCENCGTHSEVTRRDLLNNIEDLNMEIDSIDPETVYLHKDTCPMCRNELSIAEIREIPS